MFIGPIVSFWAKWAANLHCGYRIICPLRLGGPGSCLGWFLGSFADPFSLHEEEKQQRRAIGCRSKGCGRRLKYTPFFSQRPQPLDLHPMARLCCFSSSCKKNGSANEPENQPRQLPGPPSLNGHMIRYPQWRFAAHLAQNETIGPINIHTSIHWIFLGHTTNQN